MTLAVSPSLRDALTEIARLEERSRSQVASMLLREGVAQRLAIQQQALDEQASAK
jgi:hypothetical protein